MTFLWTDSASYQPRVRDAVGERRANAVGETPPYPITHDRHEDSSGRARPHNPYRSALATHAYDDEQRSNPTSDTVTAATLMQRPVVTTAPSALLTQVWTHIQENPYRHLVVIDPASNEIVGMVSDRSLTLALLQAERNGQTDVNIAAVMRSPVLVATTDTDIRHVAKIMTTQRVGAIPVLNEAHQLAGIITRSDVLRAMVTHHELTLWA